MTVTGLHMIVGLAAAGGFLLVFYGPWQAVCADYARQLVFEKRDAIFDLAHAGALSFDSREYRTIRSALEELLRFAHDVTLPRMLVVGLVAWVRGELSQRLPIDRAIDGIRDPEVRATVSALVRSAIRSLVIMIAFRSLWVVLLFPITIVALLFFAVFHNSARAVVRLIGRIIQVETIGNPHDTSTATA